MKNNNTMIDFANKVNGELVTRFLQSGERSTVHIVTLTYQRDITNEFKKILNEVILLNPTIDEVEECINKICPREVLVHIFELSNNHIRLQILKMPKCRVID